MFIRNAPELIDNKIIQTYYCGSPKLKDFLVNNGISPIYHFKHDRSQRQIWVFLQCDDLSKLLTEWTNNRPSDILTGGENIG